jgi:nicotinate-nucleotide--dimethylbenzimidazole phosphoribosyltransferase
MADIHTPPTSRKTPKTKGERRGKEPGHIVQLEHLGLPYLFDLDFRLGEGTGGVMAVPFMRGAASLLHDMATFDEAGVAGRSRHKKDS